MTISQVLIRVWGFHRTELLSSGYTLRDFKEPRFTFYLVEWDVCLIRVDSPFVYDDYVAPVCIWPFPIWDNEEVYLGGWGNLEENGNTPDQLQEVQGTF